MKKISTVPTASSSDANRDLLRQVLQRTPHPDAILAGTNAPFLARPTSCSITRQVDPPPAKHRIQKGGLKARPPFALIIASLRVQQLKNAFRWHSTGRARSSADSRGEKNRSAIWMSATLGRMYSISTPSSRPRVIAQRASSPE